MKKLLSLILAIMMIATLIPTAFAADGETTTVTYTYNFKNGSWIERGHPTTGVRSIKSDVKELGTEILTDVQWAYLGSNSVTPTGTAATSDGRWNIVAGDYNKDALRTGEIPLNGWVALLIEIPTSGIYKAKLTAYANNLCSNSVDMYIFPHDAAVTIDTYVGELAAAFSQQSVYGQFTTVDNAVVRQDAKSFSDFHFSSIIKDDYKLISAADLYSSTSQANQKTASEISATQYEVELSEGKHVVMFCSNQEDKAINIQNLTLTAEIEDEPTNTPVELTGNITFGAGDAIQYKKTTDTEFKTLAANGVDSTSFVAGDSVTVKVTNTTNFAGWVRGTADSGVWVSSDAEYTFNIMSPTYLTPIYTTPEASATHAVEFWDENGAYVGTVTATDGKAVFPAEDKYGLVGGSLTGWWLNATQQLLEGDDVAEGITRAVARYNYGSFGTTISRDEPTAKYWKRGDDVVAYGNSYDFYQWNDTPTITFGTEEITQNPLVVLDSTPVDGAYMIEYDKGNASEIVEAGILFGSDKDIVIGSTDGSKAASQRNGVDADEGDNNDHGQFCAKPNDDEAYARGYLIYRADNKLYVIYTDALAISAQ